MGMLNLRLPLDMNFSFTSMKPAFILVKYNLHEFNYMMLNRSSIGCRGVVKLGLVVTFLATVLLTVSTLPAAAPGIPVVEGDSGVDVNSSFTSTAPTVNVPNAVMASLPSWPFLGAFEWADAEKVGLFSEDDTPGGPWTMIKNELYYPQKDKFADLTISTTSGPSSPPWAPGWLFIMNTDTDLYVGVEINPANKQCFEEPTEIICKAGHSDKLMLQFDLDGDYKSDLELLWDFKNDENTLKDGITAAANETIPTVYEAKIPLANLNISTPLTGSVTIGFWASAHASPHCGGKEQPPCQFSPPPPPNDVPEFGGGAVLSVGVAFVLIRMMRRPKVKRV